MSGDKPRVLLVGDNAVRLAAAQMAIMAAAPMLNVVIRRDDDRERMLRDIYIDEYPLAADMFEAGLRQGQPAYHRVVQLRADPDKAHYESPRPLTKRQRRRRKGKLS